MTPEEDFTAGEIDKPELVSIRRSTNGMVDGVQIQMLSFMGEKWGIGEPRFSAEQVIGFSRKVWEAGGAVTWDVPVGLEGKIAQPFMERLAALGKAARAQ